MAMMIQRLAAAARRATVKTDRTFSSLSIEAEVGARVEVCGRGDKRSKKGKRFKGSFGNSRPKLDKKIERIKDRVEVSKLPKVSRIVVTYLERWTEEYAHQNDKFGLSMLTGEFV